MKTKMKSNKQGHCPHCDSNNLEYGALEFEREMFYFPFECKECGQIGEEWYYMEFSGHNVVNEEGKREEVKRTCTQCDKEMTKGYCIENGIEYYCSEECLHKNISEEEFNELYDNGNGDSYWTEWEEN